MTAGGFVEALRAFDAEDPVSISVYPSELMAWCEAHDACLAVNGSGGPMLTGSLDYVKRPHAAD